MILVDKMKITMKLRIWGMGRLAILMTSILWFSCDLSSDDGPNCLNGEGSLVQETRTAGSFDAIFHQFPGSIFITKGSFPSVVVEGQSNLLPFLNTEIADDLLSVTFTDCIETGQPFNVYVSVTSLETINLAGIGNVEFENEVVTPRLELVTTGLGDFFIQGAADTLEITINGQGNVNGFDMISERCDILIAGTGDVEVTANQELFVIINGQGNVFYKGMPTVVSDINGLGTVTDAN